MIKAKVAQWLIRATPVARLQGRSPYEVVTGMKPQGPMEGVLRRVQSAAFGVQDYVIDLIKNMTSIHKCIESSLVI